jgi:ATP-dependent DNA helicase PIF1
VSWIGRIPYDPQLNGPVAIPSYIMQTKELESLLSTIYPSDVLRPQNHAEDVFTDRAVLTVHNETVLQLNALMLSRYPGPVRTLFSVDTADINDSSGDLHHVPIEELQGCSPPQLPLSLLQLKVGVPVMLLRNIVPQEGLCNGSRMVVLAITPHCLQVRLLGEQFHGHLRTIPRIKLQTNEGDYPYILTRKQFPVRLCFAMTINKSQGQSFKHVGVDLRVPTFSHGQFYVAMSRTSSVAGLQVLLPKGEDNTTQNVVYLEVLVGIN